MTHSFPTRRSSDLLRRTRDQAGRDARTEDTEAEKRKARQHEAHRLADIGFLPLQSGNELREETGADTDDDGEHHHLDTRRDDIAEHALSEETGAVPQREWHQHEPGKRSQFELDDRDEPLKERKSTR